MQHSLGLKGLLLLIAFPLYSQKLPPSFDDSIRVVIRKQSGYEEKVDIYRATIEKVLQVDQELARTYIEALRKRLVYSIYPVIMKALAHYLIKRAQRMKKPGNYRHHY